jgi:hypothetical protein
MLEAGDDSRRPRASCRFREADASLGIAKEPADQTHRSATAIGSRSVTPPAGRGWVADRGPRAAARLCEQPAFEPTPTRDAAGYRGAGRNAGALTPLRGQPTRNDVRRPITTPSSATSSPIAAGAHRDGLLRHGSASAPAALSFTSKPPFVQGLDPQTVRHTPELWRPMPTLRARRPAISGAIPGFPRLFRSRDS